MGLQIEINGSPLASQKTALLAVALNDEQAQAGALQALAGELGDFDKALGGAVRNALETRDFRGGRDETLLLSGTSDGPRRVLLVGLGSAADRPGSLRRAAAVAARQAKKLGTGEIAFYAGELNEREAECITAGLNAGSWEFVETKTPPPEKDRRKPVERAVIVAKESEETKRGVATGQAIAEGHGLARKLAMMPGNLCTPDYLAETARDLTQRHGMKLTVLGRAEMEKEKMGAFLCVAQGTPQDPKLVTMEYSGGNAGDKPIVLVGKGLCFDSGGISIKPAQSMEMMKFDMCGAAGVIGAMETIGRLKPKINVVGIFGATTNMPSGTAVKPGDVVRAMSGKYIEIINTDAEGRLVLADLLAYASRFKPQAVIDAATLTGAAVIALGHTATITFGDDAKLVDEVLAAGRKAGEPGWQLPMWDEYKDLIKSDVADIVNSGGRPAGSITAAMFLKEFATDYPWVHLDIAGTAYSESDLVALPKGPTGIPVGTFVEFVRGRSA